MAIYRCETRNIGRADNSIGRSVVACAAYRAGEKLKDERYQATPDYSRRAEGVVHSEILTPDNVPAWASDREILWNQVEKSEKRKDSRLAREFVVALPYELTEDERRDLVMGFAREELVDLGMVVDISIHAPKTGLNHHAHLLCTTREISASGFGKKEREWNSTESLEAWREAWETHTNAALEKAGLAVRVDRRSLEDRGVDLVPEPKVGPAAAALERAGFETENGNARRDVRRENQMMAAIQDVVSFGEVSEFPLLGVGESWVERLWNVFEDGFDKVMNKAVSLLRDESGVSGSWVAREASRREAVEEIELGL